MDPHEVEWQSVVRNRLDLVTGEHRSEPVTDDNVRSVRVTRRTQASTDGQDLVAGNLRVQSKGGQIVPTSIPAGSEGAANNVQRKSYGKQPPMVRPVKVGNRQRRSGPKPFTRGMLRGR